MLNALLRCFRSDSKAATHFERIDTIKDLWVLELEANRGRESWSVWLSDVQNRISSDEAFFASLSEGSTDFTLHITVEMSEIQAVRIPTFFSSLAAKIGFQVEIFRPAA